MSHRTKLVLIKEIIDKHYYFDPKFYNFDFKNRMLYTEDRRVQLQLNFNFVNINIKYLYFIVSVMELNLLEIIDLEKRNEVINIVAKYLQLKMSFRSRQKWGIFRKFVNGKEVKRITIILSDEEFEKSYTSKLINLQMSRKSKDSHLLDHIEFKKLFENSN